MPRAASAGREAAAAGKDKPPVRKRPGRPGLDERPRPPWGNFPLSELVVLLGIVVIVWGALSDGDARNQRIGAGLVIAALGGLELAVREHLAGFRSHSTMLAGAAAFAVVTVLALGPGPQHAGSAGDHRRAGVRRRASTGCASCSGGARAA